jgi:hypothetical protein
MILYIGGPSLTADVETTTELGQLVLQITERNIDLDPVKIRFFVVVVDCN